MAPYSIIDLFSQTKRQTVIGYLTDEVWVVALAVRLPVHILVKTLASMLVQERATD
jgi:hypothetical protein